MAYLRKDLKKGKTYLSICESYRNEDGKPSRRTLHNLGCVEKLGEHNLKKIAAQLLTFLGEDVPDFETREIERLNYGFASVIHKVLQQYGLIDFFRRKSSQHNLSYNLLKPLLLMLCDRVNDPVSKLGSYNLQSEYYGLGKVELQHIYRSLNYLNLHNKNIQKHIYEYNKTLFNYQLDVVFFDVTTFYFDSDVVVEDSIRQMGFGKDGKIGKTQILFSLLIDKNKMPIGFEVFDGKTFEGHTFEKALTELKKQYNIGKVIVVADSGMMSKANIAHFKKGGTAEEYEYIVGDRLKALPRLIKAQLINHKNYTTSKTDDNGSTIKVCIVKHDDKTIIGTWSAKRAAKDKHVREQKLAKAEVLLNNTSQLNKKASRYFIKKSGEEKYILDQKKIAEDELYDGFKAIATNAVEISVEQILEQYSNLYKIEQSFRTFKSFLETRPMFHWTTERIMGHLVMCYIAFVVMRFIEEKTNFTETQIRQVLSKMQLSKIESNNKTFWLRSAENTQANHIIEKMGLKPMPNTIEIDELENYLPTVL